MREVKIKAKIGEKIKIVDAFFSLGSYKNGDVLTVSRVWDGWNAYDCRVYVKEFEQPFIIESEYVVLEGENEMRFKVGDIVKVVENVNMHRFEIGEFIRITNVTDSDYRAESLGGTEAWWVIDRELEPVPFTLSDLKPCMVVKRRCGELNIVSESEKGLVVNGSGWLPLNKYTDDLLFADRINACFDIMEVYGFSEYEHRANEISTKGRELLFKREEPKPKRKMTVAEICKELGEEIEIVKGE